jgi:hypothetical protein
MATSFQVTSPWVAVVQYFKGQPALIAPDVFNGQIAGKHKYGNEPNKWKPGSLGFTVKPDPSLPNIYVKDSESRYECNIFADSEFEIDRAFQVVNAIIRDFQRVQVGTALIQRMYFETTPSLLEDPTLRVPYFMFFIHATVSEQALPLPN